MISGTMVVRNCIEHDYCLEAALSSLAHVTDEVVVVDVESTDGTVDLIKAIPANIRVLHMPYDGNRANGTWLYKASEMARLAISHDYHVNLEADEVLHEDSKDVIRSIAEEGKAARLTIYGFWRSRRTIQILRGSVVRCAPKRHVFKEGLWSVLFDPDRMDIPQSEAGVLEDRFQIFHYGFIRPWDKWRKKTMGIQAERGMIFDKRWLNETPDEMWAERDNELTPFTGTHPKWVAKWLNEHPENA